MATTQPPLPGRTTANDRLIASTPYTSLTQRQKDYAAKYGVRLQAAPVRPTAPAATAPPPTSTPAPTNNSPAPDKGGWMHPSTGLGINPGFPGAQPEADFDHDAWALIRNVLAQYGLPDSLAEWAKQELIAGKGNAEILLDLRQRPEFKAEFPEIDARLEANKKGARLAPLSPGDIVSYRDNARQMMRAAGLPEGFYDSKDDFSGFLVKDVSLAELNDRVTQAKDATFNIPEQAKTRLAQEFGVTPGSGLLTAFFLDPDKALPLITRDLNAAKIGARSDLAGYSGVSNDTARTLADQGVSDGQAAQGFGDLAASAGLFNPLDAGETAIDQQTQLGAAFSNNADAQRRIEDRRARRKAQFAGGGGFAETQRGLVGLGAADQT